MTEIGRDCPFEGACPAIDVDYAAMRDTCDRAAFGKMCGAIVMERVLHDSTDVKDLSGPLDKYFGLITARARVCHVPQGDAPEDVRASTVGAYYPLRENRPTDGGVWVTHADLWLTLMSRGLVDTANHYTGLTQGDLSQQWWVFGEGEVAISPVPEPTSTFAYYHQAYYLRGVPVQNGLLGYAARVLHEHTLQTLSSIGQRFAQNPHVGIRPVASTFGGRSVEDAPLPE